MKKTKIFFKKLLCRIILGRDFISPKEISKKRGIVYSLDDLVMFDNTIPDWKTIWWCKKNNYMLVAGPNSPMSLLEIREVDCRFSRPYFSRQSGWYTDGDFSKNDKVEKKWYMIRKSMLPKSNSKTWIEQEKLISNVEFIPNISEFIWAITTYKAVRDVYLFSRVFVRISSIGSDGLSVVVGLFDSIGMYIATSRNEPEDYFGLAVARK